MGFAGVWRGVVTGLRVASDMFLIAFSALRNHNDKRHENHHDTIMDNNSSVGIPEVPFGDGTYKPLASAGRYRLTRDIGVNFVTVYQCGDEWFGRYDESTSGQQLHWWPFSERGEWELVEN